MGKALALLLMAQAPVTAAVVEDPNDPAFLIGKELRCPVCQGMPVADSPSDMARDMMKRVRELHNEGKSKDEVLDYFVQSYGEWVLLRPSTSGVNWLVWVLPPFGLLLGIFSVRTYIRGTKDVTPIATEEDSGDDYLAMVRKEVER